MSLTRTLCYANKVYKERGLHLRDLLFPRQLQFFDDKSKRKAAICSRRAGKSYEVSVELLTAAMDPVEGDCAYIGLTRKAAKQIMFSQLLKVNTTHKCGLQGNVSDLSFQAKNGNTIYLTGGNDEAEAEKLRGLKLKKVVLDEVASFRTHINYLIEEVLEPTLIDTNGEMILIGTPSANPEENYFHKVTTGLEPGWSVHKWTILDNIHIPHAKMWLDDYKIRKGWDDEHPIYRREWLGLWTSDLDSLVYKYNEKINDYDTIPAGHEWFYVMGADIGFDDAFTISVLAFSRYLNKTYVVDTFKKSGLIPEQMSQVIFSFKDKWNPHKIVADHGGLGKAICEEFNQRYGLPIIPAEKKKKLAYIEMLNGDLRAGTLLIHKESDLAHEMRVHQWHPDYIGIKEDDRTENDLCDSMLYAWRECKHFASESLPTKPKTDTPEYYALLAKEMERKELEQFQKQERELNGLI